MWNKLVRPNEKISVFQDTVFLFAIILCILKGIFIFYYII